MTQPVQENDLPPNSLMGVITVEGELGVTRHPNCPICGNEGCEIVHNSGEETQ